jgi:hypothetical protein
VGWGPGSVAEHLSHACNDLHLIPRTTKRERKSVRLMLLSGEWVVTKSLCPVYSIGAGLPFFGGGYV